MKTHFELDKELAWLDDLHKELLELKSKFDSAGKGAHPYYVKPSEIELEADNDKL